MRIGIDVDDVIYPWLDTAHELSVRADITNGNPVTQWEVHKDYGCHRDEWIAVLDSNIHELYSQDPLPGVLGALGRLVEAGHELVFVTARGSFGERGDEIMAITERWMSKSIPFRYELHFAKDKTTVPTDWFIDDNADNVRSLIAAGRKAYVRTRPWNASEDLPRVDDFPAFVRLILDGETRVTSSTGGQKGSKAQRYDLIPAGPLRMVAELYGKGAAKYEDRNWEKGYDWSLSFAALNRHLWQFWDGEDYDEETGAPHLACVIFHAMGLLEFMKTHPEFDNRPK